MDSNSGFGSNGSPYEYTVAQAKSKSLRLKKLALIAAYVLWALAVFLVCSMTRLFVQLIALVPISLWILVFFTWKYTQVEYEYSFFSGKLTVTKILGGRTRKKLVEVMIRDINAIFPYENVHVSRAEKWNANVSVYAASSLQAPELYLALWENEESGKRYLLCFEPNEKALKIMKYYNMSAFAK
ncbi:MAG: hypothetical protein IJW29_09755 [Clostridia bacterium]|nr:hypothetical protein [Clostridia bacterium]